MSLERRDKHALSLVATSSLLLWPPPDRSFLDFVNTPCMQEIKDRSIFIHVDMPGHHDNADNLPEG